MIYRKIHPAHSTWSSMGLFQRDLTTFDEKPFLENNRFANDCCHCHMLRNNDPNTATVVIRSSHYGNSLLVISNGTAEAIRGSVGFSVAQPRISPDGHWVFFCAIPYGCWPTYDPTSDIYGIDLVAGQASGKYTPRKLELNSDECESWLSWSSNSRWVVFSSKRISPLFNRPHIAYVAADGHCGKPIILPQ